MRTADTRAGQDYIILLSNIYKSKHLKNPDMINPSHGTKGTLVDKKKYKYDSYSRNQYTQLSMVLEAGPGEPWGLLFEFVNQSGQASWTVIRPGDVVGDAGPIEARWAQEKADHEKYLAEQERERIRRDDLIKETRKRIESQTEYFRETFEKLSRPGAGARMNFHMRNNYGEAPSGSVELDFEDALVWIEKASDLLYGGE